MNIRDFTATARQLLVAGLALAPDDRVQTYERYLDLLKFFEKLAAPAPDSPPVVRYQFEVVHELAAGSRGRTACRAASIGQSETARGLSECRRSRHVFVRDGWRDRT